MLTDVNLCREILFKYADEPCYPTKIQADDLYTMFPDRPTVEVDFNLIALDRAGLLIVDHCWIGSRASSQYYIGAIHGISPHKGSEFVRNARNPKLWEAAKQECLRRLGELALGRMEELVNSLPLPIG